MSEADFSSLPISKMRSTLKSLGLSGAGTKVEMLERYREYLATSSAVVNIQDAENTETTNQEPVEAENAPEVPNADADGAVSVSEGVVPSDQNANEELQTEETVSTEANLNENVISEEVPAEAVPVESAPAETEPVEGAPVDSIPVVAETAQIASSETAQAPAAEAEAEAEEEFDIEVELDKREMRSKKFGTTFDREACRQQLLREHSGKPTVEFKAGKGVDPDREKRIQERQAKFGVVEPNKRMMRRQRFNMMNGADNSTDVSADLLSERQKKFGVVEQTFKPRRGIKRNGANFRSFKNRRY